VEINVPITGATKCKVTYDTKGLVTSGADLVKGDLPTEALLSDNLITAIAESRTDKIVSEKALADYAISTGAGDMLKAVFDPTGKNQDIFAYVDAEVSEVNASLTTFIGTKGAANGICDLDLTGNVPASRLGNVISGAPYLTQDLNLYVATTGNDTTGDGSSGNPYASITKALSIIPKNLNGHSIIINISAGTYPEDVYIPSYYNGSQYINTAKSCDVLIHLTGNVLIKRMVIDNTRVTIEGSYTIQRISGETSGYFITTLSTATLYMVGVTIVAQESGILNVSDFSIVTSGTLSSAHSIAAITAVYCQGFLKITQTLINLTGSSTTGLSVSGGGLIRVNAPSTLVAATRIYKTDGGEIKTGAGVDLI